MRKAVVVLAAVTSVSTSLPAAAQQDAFSLRGLVVTASPTPRSVESVASHVTILEGEELRLRGVASLGEVLRDVAGVDVVRSGSFGALTSVFLRGGESDYTLVLVDGVQVNQPGGGFDFAALSLDNVERVEVVRGPSSALYGSDAVAGVIHIVTRDARGPTRARASVETGSYGEPRGHLVDGLRWSADVEGGTGSAGYSVSLSRDATDGLLGFNNRHESTVLVGNARLLPEAQTRIDLMLRLSDRRYHFPTDGSGAVSDVNAFNYTDAATAHVRLARRIGDRLEVEARLGLHETDGGLDDAQDGPADTLGFFESSSLEHFRRASGEVRANLRLRSGVVVTGGGELEDEGQRTFSESRSEFGPSTGRSDSERLNRAVFLHATAGGPEVGLNVGGRLEDNERFGSVGTWQVGLSALVPGSGGARVRASAGSAIKEPTFYENYATGFARGNPDLEPERSGAWEVGLERQLLADAATVRLTYFSQRFRDLIQYTFTPPAPTEPNFFNVAKAAARGLEVDAQLR
ncbi:MAG TPA: TonB-dependent receptor, partial [Longimicrobiales bacterium]|nr:TonB-dependent receptor [Longimicrobiales bacterium]